MTTEQKKYYVYILCDPRYSGEEWGREWKPFYVGKGSERRAIRHLEEGKRSTENIRKYYKIQKIRKEGLEPIIEYHMIDLAENDAYQIETELIKKYGRKDFDEGGILTNILLDGRPPVRSGPMSEEQKDAIRKGNTGKKRNKEQSAYLSLIRKGKTRKSPSEETREKIRLSNIAAKADKKLSDDLTGMVFGEWTMIAKGRDMRPRIRGAKGIYWLSRCSCGTLKEVQQSSLTKGLSTSCGCLMKSQQENIWFIEYKTV